MNYDLYSISGPKTSPLKVPSNDTPSPNDNEKPREKEDKLEDERLPLYEQSILKFACVRSMLNSRHISAVKHLLPHEADWSDHFCVSMYEKRIVGILSDGGQLLGRASQVSQIAKTSFSNYVFKHINEKFDTVEIAILMLNGIRKVYESICANLENYGGPPTSMMGAVVVELSDKEKENKWGLLSVRLGKCVGYHFSFKTKKFVELCSDSPIANISKDKDHLPLDLTSVSLHFSACDEGDIVTLLSDGLFDMEMSDNSLISSSSLGTLNGLSVSSIGNGTEDARVRKGSHKVLEDSATSSNNGYNGLLQGFDTEVPPDGITPQHMSSFLLNNALRHGDLILQQRAQFFRADCATTVSFIITGQKMKTKFPIPFELLEPKKMIKKLTEFLQDDDLRYLEQLLSDLPRYGVKRFRHILQGDICSIHGPSQTEDLLNINGQEKNIGDYACARVLSTYPSLPNSKTRFGDPVCDYYTVKVLKGRTFGVVTDGCSFSEAALDASVKANTAFIDCLSKFHTQITNTTEAGVQLLNAVRKAQKSIFHRKDRRDVGSTTLMGGMLVQLTPNENQWGFISVSLGECRGFHFNSIRKQVSPLVGVRRRFIGDDSSDPGGRLGLHQNGSGPDLRNLELNFISCEEGDVIVMMSDGIWENFDPEILGRLPKDLGGSITATSWSNLSKEERADLKYKHTYKLIEEIIGKKEMINPKQIVDQLAEHAVRTTVKVRQKMIETNGKKLPFDFQNFPGKLDHATCIAFQVTKASKYLTDKPKMPHLSAKYEIQTDLWKGLLEGSQKFLEVCQAKPVEFLFRNIPKLQLQKTKDLTEVGHICGPERTEGESTETELGIGNYASAHCFSSYPLLPGRARKEGDPICDYFSIKLLKRRAVMALSDGCNWGPKPLEAAFQANTKFVEYVVKLQNSITNTTEVCIALLTALRKAHEAIIKNKQDVWEAGTTTLAGGLLFQLRGEDDTKEANSQWGYVSICVGDCKVVHWQASKNKFVAITSGIRRTMQEVTDPGGRLGPSKQDTIGLPDLTNLELSYTHCQEGDLICVMSDGVHDNLDPEQLGKQPADLGLTHATEWREMSDEELARVKNEYMCSVMEKLLLSANEPITPKFVTNALMKHCKEVTQSSRDYLMNNRASKLPKDYIKYPGKMDHTTCCCVHVPRGDRTQKMSGTFQKLQLLNNSEGSESIKSPIKPKGFRQRKNKS